MRIGEAVKLQKLGDQYPQKSADASGITGRRHNAQKQLFTVQERCR